MALEKGFKFRAGDFVVCHTGHMEYTVTRRSTGEVQRVFKDLGSSSGYAKSRCQLEHESQEPHA